MKLWTFLLLMVSSFTFGQDIQTLQQNYKISLAETTAYALKVKDIYNNPQTQQKLIELISNQQVNLEDIQIDFAQNLGTNESIVIKSPFTNTDKINDPNSFIYKDHFSPDIPKIDSILGEYSKVMESITKHKKSIDLLNTSLYQILLDMINSSQKTLNILKQMKW